jgi:hypothetical protein
MASIISDSARRISTAFNRGVNTVLEPYNKPGPELKVSPFSAGTEQPGSIALKSIASLIAGQRAEANAAVKQRRLDTMDKYREAQIEKLTAQAASAGAPKPGPRIQVSPDDAKRLGIDYDPETGTVDQRSAAFNASQQLHSTIRSDLDRRFNISEGRRNRQFETREGRLSSARALTEADTGWKQLEREADQIASVSAQRAASEADNAIKVLTSPIVSPQRKAYYANVLGLGQKMYQIDLTKPGNVPMLDQNGNPIYDLTRLNEARDRYVETRKAVGRRRAVAEQAAQRIMYSQVLRGAEPEAGSEYGPEDGGNDPILEAVKELARQYARQQGPQPPVPHDASEGGPDQIPIDDDEEGP